MVNHYLDSIGRRTGGSGGEAVLKLNAIVAVDRKGRQQILQGLVGDDYDGAYALILYILQEPNR